LSVSALIATPQFWQLPPEKPVDPVVPLQLRLKQC
jgi:hypothetical protein